MESELMILIAGAASIAFIHTLLGPDHYLPFVALAKARAWSLKKTITITATCGIGHAVGSILLGIAGVWFGQQMSGLMDIEGLRGDWAAYALIAFGLMYFAWGMKRAYKKKEHTHGHTHPDGSSHVHTHSHFGGHAHPHVESEVDLKSFAAMTPWALFIIFVLGPCEPLIPLMMAPGADAMFSVAMIVTAFTVVTIGTMLAVVYVGYRGLEFVPVKKFERFVHAIAGGTVALCGVAITMGL